MHRLQRDVAAASTRMTIGGPGSPFGAVGRIVRSSTSTRRCEHVTNVWRGDPAGHYLHLDCTDFVEAQLSEKTEEHGILLERIPKGVPLFLGVQNLFLDTTFREGGLFWDTKNFFWDTNVFFLGTKCFFLDTETFFGMQIFSGYKSFWLTKIPEHHTNYKKTSKIIEINK